MELIRQLVDDASALINIIYHKPTRRTNWKDYLDIIYVDNDGETQIVNVEEPMMEIYFAKEHARETSFNRNYIRKSDAYSKLVKFRNIEREIANESGGSTKRVYEEALSSGNRTATKNVHKDPNVFASDYRIEDWYRIQWVIESNKKTTESTRVKLHKNFLDIEVDGIDHPGFVLGGIAPINAVTIVDDKTLACRTFLLRNEKNPLIAEFEKDIPGFIEELHESFDEVYGSLDYQIYMYDEADEISMIRDIFSMLNVVKPHFVLIWNASFDIPYIIDRINVLGYDPADIMTHPEFPLREVYFYKDKRNFSIPDKGDYTKISTPFMVLDQMIVYAGLRKSQSEIRSFNLNSVGKSELDEGKLDYGEVKDFKTFPYENYKLFVMYNIKDVLLQLGIERRTNDMENLYTRASNNATAYEKIFKQTVFLKNRSYIEWDKQGLYTGNNTNIRYGEDYSMSNIMIKKDDEEESYAGGVVADPKLNKPVGEMVMGRPSKYIFSFVADMDFGAMYPSIIIAFNIAPNTMFGKLIIGTDGAQLYADIMNSEDIEEIMSSVDLGAEFADDLQVGDLLTIGKKWFGLPDIEQLIHEFGVAHGNGSSNKVRVTNNKMEETTNDNTGRVFEKLHINR